MPMRGRAFPGRTSVPPIWFASLATRSRYARAHKEDRLVDLPYRHKFLLPAQVPSRLESKQLVHSGVLRPVSGSDTPRVPTSDQAMTFCRTSLLTSRT
jgi:hypothetical protein